MPINIRSQIKTYSCINGVVCGQDIDPVFQNLLNENSKAIANTGVLVCSHSNGFTHGRTRPFHGWMPGKNLITLQTTTTQMIELSGTYDSYVLQFEGKLGDIGGGNAMQWMNFYIVEPTSGYQQRLGEMKLGVSVSPVEFQASSNTQTRVRISMPLDAALLALIPAGKTIGAYFQTRITQYGSGTRSITDNNYWAGILSCEFKVFNSCQ